MEVILREDVHNVGRAGELVKVRPGFGRNYLIPHGLAYEATAGNIRRIESESKRVAEKRAHMKGAADQIAAALADVEIRFTAKAGEGDKLFGSITTADIAAELKKRGHDIDKRIIALQEPIKSLGTRDVTLRLHHDVQAVIKVTVEKE